MYLYIVIMTNTDINTSLNVSYLQKRTHFHHLIRKKNYYSNELLSCL